MRPQRIYFLPRAADADGIATTQTPGAAGDLTLDGALVTGGVAVIHQFGTKDSNGRPYNLHGQQVTLTSDANESGINFTITGLDQDRQSYTVTQAGPNATTDTVAGYFSEVTSVSVDGAGTGNITVGITALSSTPTVYLDQYEGDGASLYLDINGTATCTVNHTFDYIEAQTWKDGYTWNAAGANWEDHDSTDLVGATASADGNYAYLPKGTRAKVTAWTSGTIEYTVIPQGR